MHDDLIQASHNQNPSSKTDRAWERIREYDE